MGQRNRGQVREAMLVRFRHVDRIDGKVEILDKALQLHKTSSF